MSDIEHFWEEDGVIHFTHFGASEYMRNIAEYLKNLIRIKLQKDNKQIVISNDEQSVLETFFVQVDENDFVLKYDNLIIFQLLGAKVVFLSKFRDLHGKEFQDLYPNPNDRRLVYKVLFEKASVQNANLELIFSQLLEQIDEIIKK